MTWSWPVGTARAGLRRLYQDLLSLRKRHAALRDFRHRTAQLTHGNAGQPLLELFRGDGAHPLYCVFNLGEEATPLPLATTGLSACLQSEDVAYGGSADRSDPGERQWLRPRECVVLSPVAKIGE